MRGSLTLAVALAYCCLLPLAAAQKITPPDDRCVQDPCVYHVPDRDLLPNQPFYVLLHNVDTADRLSVAVTEVRCRKPPCPPVLVYFLREAEFSKLERDQPFLPDHGSLTNASMEARDAYVAHTVLTGFEERYYAVLLNPGPQPVLADVEVTFQVADCLLFMASLLLVPLLVLSLCFCVFRARGSERKKRAQQQQRAGSPRRYVSVPSDPYSPGQEQQTLCCCEFRTYDPTQDRPPAPVCCARGASCKLPRWNWVAGYPGLLWRRPSVSYAHWWRQQVLLTWPWNPEEDEALDLGARQIYVLIILLYNLLVQTLWNEMMVSANSSMTRVMPAEMSTYWSRYAGSLGFQYLFYAIFKPLLTVLFVHAPEWRRDRQSACRRVAGAVLGYALQILFVLLLLAVSYSTLVLLRQYRCSVLLSSLILPYFTFELVKMCMFFGCIPLPLMYCILNTFGPEIQVPMGPGYSGPPTSYPPPPPAPGTTAPTARGVTSVASSQRRGGGTGNSVTRAAYGGSYHQEEEEDVDETTPLARP